MFSGERGPAPSFKGTRADQVPKELSALPALVRVLSLSCFFPDGHSMHSTAKHKSPGCGHHFLPGGYTNPLPVNGHGLQRVSNVNEVAVSLHG